jgi:hypothetical protein
MTVPAEGVERLIHFVDARIAQLSLSKEEVARRGGPSRDTLAKIRDRRDQHTPRVSTLLRLDASLGWKPGSSAVVLHGGQPLSLTAHSRPETVARHKAAQPVSGAEIMRRLADQLHDEIARLEGTHEALGIHIGRLRNVRDNFVAELTVDDDLIADYDCDVPEKPSAATG